MISGNLLRSAVISGANNISNNRKMVDELNVFPVPDGDTGTNMLETPQRLFLQHFFVVLVVTLVLFCRLSSVVFQKALKGWTKQALKI